MLASALQAGNEKIKNKLLWVSALLFVLCILIFAMVGIISYGVSIPRYRVTVEEIAKTWGKNPEEVKRGLGIREKAVPGIDEDAATLAVEAGRCALDRVQVKPESIGALFVGSESHPYAVNPTATTVGEFLGIGHNYHSADLEFACKAGTTGMQIVAGLIGSGKIDHGLAIGSDTAQAKPHDVLEYSAGAGAAAFILGNKKTEILAELVDFASYASDTPDFWRRDGIAYPSHGGRFTGEPAYFAHVVGAATTLLEKTKLKPADFDYCIFHMPNGKFPRDVAKRLGFTQEQLNSGYIVTTMGNPYSASCMLGLAKVLDEAKSGQMIFMVSYGSGAGSDAFVFRVLKSAPRGEKSPTVSGLLARAKYVSYAQYLKMTKKI